MTSPNSTYANDLLSLTMQEMDGDLFDQIKVKNATIALLDEHGQVRAVDGSPTIVVPIMFAENGSYTRYTGADPLNTTTDDVFSVWQANWKQIALNVQATGREIALNSGKGQIRDLVRSRIMNAKVSYENNFNEDTLSDGAATNQITGLQAHIADDGTGTIQGVARSAYSFAKNQFYRGTTDGGAATTALNLVSYMDSLDLLCQTWRAKTKAILADNAFFKLYETAVHPLQRVTQEKGALGKLGFRTYQYKDAEVVFEPTTAGMPASTMYFLDPECLELRYVRGRNMARLPKRDSFNQDMQIEYLASIVQLVGLNYRRLGVLNND